jgi:dUTP pyrophosphatase
MNNPDWTESPKDATHWDTVAGVVDADFIGAVKVAMINHGDDTIELRQGDRIAQLIVERCSQGDLIEVSSP